MRASKTRLAAGVAVLAALVIPVPEAAHAAGPARAGGAGTVVRPAGDTRYQFVNLFGRVLAVGGGQLYDGAPVVQWANTGTADQYWTVDHLADGAFRIRNLSRETAGISYCLDVPDDDPTVGRQLQVWTCNANTQQQWYWWTPMHLPLPPVGYDHLNNVGTGRVLAVGGGNDKIGGPVI